MPGYMQVSMPVQALRPIAFPQPLGQTGPPCDAIAQQAHLLGPVHAHEAVHLPGVHHLLL